MVERWLKLVGVDEKRMKKYCILRFCVDDCLVGGGLREVGWICWVIKEKKYCDFDGLRFEMVGY